MLASIQAGWRSPRVTLVSFRPSFRTPQSSPPPMRYIRFLKPPRVAASKAASQHQIHCLITITSDLGDSFLPYDVELSAELLACEPHEEVIVWRTIHWTAGMRSLAITLPLPRSRAPSSLRVRVGSQSRCKHDVYDALLAPGSRGVVSAWSARFTASSSEAARLVERRFVLSEGPHLSIWEETGESIARHLW